MNIMVVLSGGIDSVVLLKDVLLTSNREDVISAIFFNWGQRPVNKEYEIADKFCKEWSVPLIRHDVVINGGKEIVVNNRNAILLLIASNHIISTSGSGIVMYGAHNSDDETFPDCRPKFVVSVNKLVTDSMGKEVVKILAPFIKYKKSDIIKRGVKLGVKVENTWSCYKSGSLHCGKCLSCKQRKDGFDLAEIEDKTIYE